MQTVYIYLSWTGWIWLLIAGTLLAIRLVKLRIVKFRRGFPVILIADKIVDPATTEAEQSNEQQ